MFQKFNSIYIVKLNNEIDFPLEDNIIGVLIGHQCHYRFIGDFGGKRREYPNSIKLLLRSYNIDHLSIIVPLKKLLQIDNNFTRINAIGVIELLQNYKPEIGIELLSDLVSSLELFDDQEDDSADGRTRHRIVDAFYYDPSKVDKYLFEELSKKRPAVQEEIVKIYREIIWGFAEKENQKPKSIKQIAITSCIEFLKDDSLDLDIRYKAVEALNIASSYVKNSIISNFESLLGYYALICTQEDPPNSLPKIILPGQIQNPELENLEKFSHRQTWGHIKLKLLGCLKEICEHDPLATIDIVIKCFDGLDTKNYPEFKSALVSLLGMIGKEYSFQSKVLPYIMKALMDFDSQCIRASAIYAVEDMFKYAKSNPPRNLMDALLIHLRDSYVIVHKAAINIFRWNSRWLDYKQTIEALNLLLGWLPVYKKDPYYLDDICKTILNISYSYPKLKSISIKHIFSVFPTNEQLVDEEIVKEVIDDLRPDEDSEGIIAEKLIWCLNAYGRDRYNSGHGPHEEFFNWLLKIPNVTYVKLKNAITEYALKAAQRDPWEACYIASLFSKFGDFVEEHKVLLNVIKSIENEKRFEIFKEKLIALNRITTSNIHLLKGDLQASRDCIFKIKGIQNEI